MIQTVYGITRMDIALPAVCWTQTEANVEQELYAFVFDLSICFVCQPILAVTPE